ncbi:MAG: hypothetical protein LBT14_12060 [Treponema sp.]|nr:hypothetical protein [Treponema sp.]
MREDTQAIRQLFTEQGFSVKPLENLSSRDLKAGIAAFFDQYGYERDVRLCVLRGPRAYLKARYHWGTSCRWTVPIPTMMS